VSRSKTLVSARTMGNLGLHVKLAEIEGRPAKVPMPEKMAYPLARLASILVCYGFTLAMQSNTTLLFVSNTA